MYRHAFSFSHSHAQAHISQSVIETRPKLNHAPKIFSAIAAGVWQQIRKRQRESERETKRKKESLGTILCCVVTPLRSVASNYKHMQSIASEV